MRQTSIAHWVSPNTVLFKYGSCLLKKQVMATMNFLLCSVSSPESSTQQLPFPQPFLQMLPLWPFSKILPCSTDDQIIDMQVLEMTPADGDSLMGQKIRDYRTGLMPRVVISTLMNIWRKCNVFCWRRCILVKRGTLWE